VSWDGRGRALDNIFVERLWRSVKYEEVYLHSYESVGEAVTQLRHYFRFYNENDLTNPWRTGLPHRSTSGVDHEQAPCLL